MRGIGVHRFVLIPALLVGGCLSDNALSTNPAAARSGEVVADCTPRTLAHDRGARIIIDAGPYVYWASHERRLNLVTVWRVLKVGGVVEKFYDEAAEGVVGLWVDAAAQEFLALQRDDGTVAVRMIAHGDNSPTGVVILDAPGEIQVVDGFLWYVASDRRQVVRVATAAISSGDPPHEVIVTSDKPIVSFDLGVNNIYIGQLRTEGIRTFVEITKTQRNGGPTAVLYSSDLLAPNFRVHDGRIYTSFQGFILRQLSPSGGTGPRGDVGTAPEGFGDAFLTEDGGALYWTVHGVFADRRRLTRTMRFDVANRTLVPIAFLDDEMEFSFDADEAFWIDGNNDIKTLPLACAGGPG